MTTEEAKQLISKYNAGNCNEQEKALLDKWYMQLDVQDLNISSKTIESLHAQIKQLPGSDSRSKNIRLWTAIAAILAVSLLSTTILLFFLRADKPPTFNNNIVRDVRPGSNKATLTISNGKIITLSSTKTGIAIDTDKISYNDGTEISHNSDDDFSELITISTPKGGVYQIKLPDCTKVWLNSATTLQFSANLKRERGERKVNLVSGEAYFEVFKDKAHPFVLTSGHQQVVVLGTQFNVNAYEPELAIKTTLKEGSVKIVNIKPDGRKSAMVISPGEQSTCTTTGIMIKEVDVSLETAWKNGKIQFENEELKPVMALLARWYNIDVEYQYYPTEARFTGSISRSKNISEVLELLQSTGDATFKIKGRKVLVMR